MQQVLRLEVDMDELTVRLMETALRVQRPEGLTASEALEALEETKTMIENPGVLEGYRRMAHAAVDYVARQITFSGETMQ